VNSIEVQIDQRRSRIYAPVAIRFGLAAGLRSRVGAVAPATTPSRRSRPSKSPSSCAQPNRRSGKDRGKGPFNMLVDTNTDPSAIDEKTARELGLSIGSSGAPASGSAPKSTRLIPRCFRPSNLEHHGEAGCRRHIDMSKISARIERPIAGVLGFSFLKDRIIQIDYGNLKLRFFASRHIPEFRWRRIR
jgi:hypothetical protein